MVNSSDKLLMNYIIARVAARKASSALLIVMNA